MPQKERNQAWLESQAVRVQEVIPVSKSKPYSSMSVNAVDVQSLTASHAGQKCIIGVDVAKLEFKAVLAWPDGSFHRPWSIKIPGQIATAVQKLAALHQVCPVTVVMESSGTYGDAFRQALADAAIPLQRVSGKAVKDQSETFDGVPSQHDGKDAAIIADLGLRGKGRPWQLAQRPALDQELRYWVRRLDRAQRIKQMHGGRIEALLARHWPEATEHVEAGSATLVRALAQWGDPAELARDTQAQEQLARFGGHYLSQEKIQALLASAHSTVGVRMNRWERREIKELAKAVLCRRKVIARCRRQLRRLAADHPIIKPQSAAVGLVTACVLWMCLGDPRNYGSAAAYRKAMGLNLTEHSSGKYKGQLRISKRGQRLSRKWLYFSAIRWMKDPAVKRWASGKKARDGGKGMRAVTGVMRRLALAAWHVPVHGVAFAAALLFPGGRSGRTTAKTPRVPAAAAGEAEQR
jgi:transposase